MITSARSNFTISANATMHDQVLQVLVGRARIVDVFCLDHPLSPNTARTLLVVFCTFVALSGEPSGDSAR